MEQKHTESHVSVYELNAQANKQISSCFLFHFFFSSCCSTVCVWRILENTITMATTKSRKHTFSMRSIVQIYYTHMIELSHSLWICCSFSFAWHSICFEPNEIYKPENILIFVEWDSQQPSGWLWWKNKIENKNKKKNEYIIKVNRYTYL